MPTATPRSSSMWVMAKDTSSFLPGIRLSRQVCAIAFAPVVQADIYNALMHIGNLACIFALDAALLQIGTVGVFRYAFYIRFDCDVLDSIPIYFKDFDQDFITDRKTLVGVSDPVPGQVSCRNGAFHSKGFDTHRFSATAITRACMVRPS